MATLLGFLVLPSAVLFGLLVFHSLRNRGPRATAIFFSAAIAYGVLRAALLREGMASAAGGLLPYLMRFPVLRLGAASLQEVVGWGLAASVSWWIADRLLRRLGLLPAPHRTAALAALGLASMSLAVETAALGAGWWTWTIKQPERALLGRVPPVGLLDWGFVAFDFLLPYLALATPAPRWVRGLTLLLFPVHFLTHPLVQPLPIVWLSPNDLVHALVVAYVLAQAVGERGLPALPEPSEERLAWIPPAAASVVALSTALVSLFVARTPAAAWASLPLVSLALGAAFLPGRVSSPAHAPKGKARKGRAAPAAAPGAGRMGLRVAVVLGVLALTFALRAPFHRRTQVLMQSIQRGADLLSAGDLAGAEDAFRAGVAARPDHPSGHAILAQLLFRQARRGEARAEAEAALDLSPTARDALILLTTLDLRERRFAEAAQRAAQGASIYPDRPEFVYQAARASAGLKGEEAEEGVARALDLARKGGPPVASALGALAGSLGDARTAQACADIVAAGDLTPPRGAQ